MQILTSVRDVWNVIVALQSPTLLDLKRHAHDWKQLRPNCAGLFFLGDNLVALSRQMSNSLNSQAQSVSLILQPSCYTGMELSPGIKFEPLVEGSILQTPFSVSGLEFAKSLKATLPKKLTLATLSSLNGKVRWEIYFGSLTLEFVPTEPDGKDPANSGLSTITFSFLQPHRASLPATIH